LVSSRLATSCGKSVVPSLRRQAADFEILQGALPLGRERQLGLARALPRLAGSWGELARVIACIMVPAMPAAKLIPNPGGVIINRSHEAQQRDTQDAATAGDYCHEARREGPQTWEHKCPTNESDYPPRA